jgi:hypothetical protein
MTLAPTRTAYDPAVPETKRWLTRRQAADLLGISPRQLDAYAETGKLPRYYLPPVRPTAGRTPRPSPRFRIEDVHALVDGPIR